MSALVRLLYPPPTPSRRPATVISWWERRRLAFNLIVGSTGVLSMLVVNLFGWLPPRSHGPMPLVAAVAFGVVANLCYTSGWMIELLFNAWWKDNPPAIGPVLFRQGLLFSIGLTMLPIGVAALDFAMRVVTWLW